MGQLEGVFNWAVRALVVKGVVSGDIVNWGVDGGHWGVGRGWGVYVGLYALAPLAPVPGLRQALRQVHHRARCHTRCCALTAPI